MWGLNCFSMMERMSPVTLFGVPLARPPTFLCPLVNRPAAVVFFSAFFSFLSPLFLSCSFFAMMLMGLFGGKDMKKGEMVCFFRLENLSIGCYLVYLSSHYNHQIQKIWD